MSRDISNLLWDDWQIESVLGKGSYATVYKVKKIGFGSNMYSAVKHMQIPYESSEISSIRCEGMTKQEIINYYEDIVNNITEEIRLMDSLKGNANIVNIEDFKIVERNNEIGWDILIRMELLDDLNEYFENKTGPISDIVNVGIDICNAIECCEQANIIHRDIKPENIFVNKFGNFKLGDFGIARQYSQNRADMSMRGTPYYVAPEIYEGKSYDLTVDVYSLGILLYRMLNKNRLPFFPIEGTVTFSQRNDALRLRIAGEKFAPPENTIPQLTQVINKACSYNPADRYQTANEFKNELQRVLAILNDMDEQPQYDFTQKYSDDVYNDIKGSTFDLAQGTIMLEENNKERPATIEKRKRIQKNIIYVVAVALILTVGITVLAYPNDKQNVVETTESTATTTASAVYDSEKETEKTTVSENKTTTEITTKKASEVTNTTATKKQNSTTAKKTTKKHTTTSKQTTTKKATTTKKQTTTKKKSTTKAATTANNATVSSVSVYKNGSGVIGVQWSCKNASYVKITISGPGCSDSKTGASSGSTKFSLGEEGSYKITVTPYSSNGKAGKSKSSTYVYEM